MQPEQIWAEKLPKSDEQALEDGAWSNHIDFQDHGSLEM